MDRDWRKDTTAQLNVAKSDFAMLFTSAPVYYVRRDGGLLSVVKVTEAKVGAGDKMHS